MSESCELIRDLIPLVKGRNASGESVRRVEGHLMGCDGCHGYYEACVIDREKRNIRRLLFVLKLLAVASLAGVGLLSRDGFWASTALAVSGAVAYFALPKGRWILPLGVIGAAFAVQFARSWQYYGQYALEGFFTQFPHILIRYLLMPGVLALGGMAAAFLCRLALCPRRKGQRLPALLKWTAFLNRSSLFLRIPAGVLAVFLAAAGLLWMNSVYGNPVSSLMAENAMRTYLHERYGSYDLTYTSTFYSWVEGTYRAEVSSPADPDLSFSLTYYNDGKVSDTYIDRVVSGGNAFERIQGELDKKLASILKTKYGSYLLWTGTLPLDNVRLLKEKVLGGLTSFTTAESPYFGIDISINLSPLTPETAAAKITEYYNYLKSKGYVFRQYGICAYEKGVTMLGNISGVTPEDIESGDLIRLLTAAMLDKDGDSAIRYYSPS